MIEEEVGTHVSAEAQADSDAEGQAAGEQKNNIEKDVTMGLCQDVPAEEPKTLAELDDPVFAEFVQKIEEVKKGFADLNLVKFVRSDGKVIHDDEPLSTVMKGKFFLMNVPADINAKFVIRFSKRDNKPLWFRRGYVKRFAVAAIEDGKVMKRGEKEAYSQWALKSFGGD